ncbi:MAG: 23S rRNA (guanosine(2251)-2'-O)-methyltransferase RlmB [Pseudomonadota bacterium]
MNTEILYGYHPVREALRANRRKIQTIYLGRESSGNRCEEILTVAASNGIPVERVTADAMRSMTRTDHHQDLCARVSVYPVVAMEDLLDALPGGKAPPFFLVIDSVLDPQNLGALIRSALAVGVIGVLTPKDRSAPPTPVVSKASAGALEHIPLARVTNLSRALDALRQRGLWIFGLEGTADREIYGTDLTGPMALVVGGEEKGIRPLVKQHCDLLVSIPQYGPLDSLNASVAGAVALYEVLRQRRDRS